MTDDAHPFGCTARRHWQLGLCPCCGMRLDWYDDIHEQEVVAEGVSLCGRCIRYKHREPDVLSLLLKAIVTGIDP